MFGHERCGKFVVGNAISVFSPSLGINLESILLADQDLRNSCLEAESQRKHSDRLERWLDELESHLQIVGSVSADEFHTEIFQRRLWDSQTVSGFGRGGAINVTSLYADPRLMSLLWKLRDGSLPPLGAERTQFLITAFLDCQALIKAKLPKLPRLKLYNVFASLAPSEFATLSFTRSIREIAAAMGIDAQRSVHPIKLHREVLDRLNKVLGEVPSPPDRRGVERMALPWLLTRQFKQSDATTANDADEKPGEEKLVPLPADRRRRGMLAIGGSFSGVRSMLEFAKDGCVREDFKEHIRSLNPRLSPQSINTNINALIAEWGVLEAEGDRLVPTTRGTTLLENDKADPDDVSDWLITRILGFDHILHSLRKEGATKEALRALLKRANPGWTSNFAPDALIDWQRALGLVERVQQGLYVLTEEGRDWSKRIYWEPEILPPTVHAEETDADAVAGSAVTPINVRRPAFAELVKAFPRDAKFTSGLIARLDASLWSNARRHFVVLAGLSGAGKTLLARSYALALWHDQPDPRLGMFTVPVQPGWHDPASLLGYINPLSTDTYVRTGFLDFLLRASGDPERAYTVVLDEMNLSHPEQYLAPLLSAMETGDDIELHAMDEDVGGVPPRLRYPSNLLIVGTVNMDETTHGLSDKILDRAAVVEFWDIDVSDYPGWDSSSLQVEDVEFLREVLVRLAAVLRPAKLHFGWRTISDIIGYIVAVRACEVISVATALDHAVYAKILPKLRGEDSKRLREAFDAAQGILREHGLKDSAAKVGELRDDLRETGSARFWR
jgi:MoxR-like ATPase